MNIQCPNYILTAISLLENRGFSAFAVGGCVRDSIMGKIPNDWDMTTSATPNEIIKTFSDFKTVPTGIKHGTVTVIIYDTPIEITTMRIDGEYSDNRRPDKVQFTSKIEEDLSRRDFTVNAMAYNPSAGLIDPFGGQSDIKSKIIRCVGNADLRFNEDALRIIRALRFASVLEFDIEHKTAESIMKNYDLLSNVANERIRIELVKLLCGKNVERILTDFKEVFFHIIPELRAEDGFCQHTPFHIYDVWEHTIKVVANSECTPTVRVAALLHDIEKPSCFRLDENGCGHFKEHPQRGAETAERILKELRFSNADIKEICTLIALHDERPNGDIKKLAHLSSQYSIETVRQVMRFIKAELYAKNPIYIEADCKKCDIALQQLDELEKSDTPLKISELKINGTDLLQLGIKSNLIGSVLSSVLNDVIDGAVDNQKDELLRYIKATPHN